MIERDDELRQILRQWDAPTPDAKLDERVLKDLPQSNRPSRWKWLPVAAGIALAVGIAAFWPAKRTNDGEFRPLPNGAITVVRTGN